MLFLLEHRHNIVLFVRIVLKLELLAEESSSQTVRDRLVLVRPRPEATLRLGAADPGLKDLYVGLLELRPFR